MKKFTLFLFFCIFLGLLSNATECENLVLTSSTYSETDNLIEAIQNEFGSNYTIADWNDLENISDINAWIICMGFPEDQSFMLTRDGNYFYSGNRQYFVRYSTDGVGSNWLIHDQIGDLYLGSWYGLDYNILAKNDCSSTECDYLKTTCDKYSETDNLIEAIQNEFGSNYTIADWNDLENISDINAWIICMGFPEDQSFMLTRDGNYFYSGNRQYFVRYSTDGVGSNWLIHDQIGDLYLGSWYGLNYNILAINGTTSVYEEKDLQLSVFPNPTNGYLTISCESKEEYILSISTMLGQIIKSIKFENNEIIVDLNQFDNGIYIVLIADKQGNLVFSEKIIKE